jgi:hypothetical protein
MVCLSAKRLPTRLSERLLALLCCILCITVSFDSVIVSQVLDGNLYARSPVPGLTEQDEPVEEDDDMLRPSTAPEIGRAARNQQRPAPGGAPGDDVVNRLAPSTFARLRALPCHSGCEHSYRNGVGTPLLC